MVGTTEEKPSSDLERASCDPDEEKDVSPFQTSFWKQELQVKYLLPQIEDNGSHGKCQWSNGRVACTLYMMHRTLWMLFWVSVLIFVLIRAGDKFWYVSAFLTQWAYATIAIGTVFRFVLAAQYLRSELDKFPDAVCTIDCLLYSAYNPISLLVSIGYWGFLYDPKDYSDKGIEFNLMNATVHLLNSVYVVMDLWVSAFPVRILMVWVPMVYLLLYAFANAVYWFFTGQSIYKDYTDWTEQPEVPIMWFSVVIFIFIPGLHLLTFAMYWARSMLFSRFIAHYHNTERVVIDEKEIEPLGWRKTTEDLELPVQLEKQELQELNKSNAPSQPYTSNIMSEVDVDMVV